MDRPENTRTAMRPASYVSSDPCACPAERRSATSLGCPESPAGDVMLDRHENETNTIRNSAQRRRTTDCPIASRQQGAHTNPANPLRRP